MATIVTRAGKGSPLTNNEVDANFNNLNTESGQILKSATTTIDVVAAAAPTVDQVLTATSGTTAIWKAPKKSIGSLLYLHANCGGF